MTGEERTIPYYFHEAVMARAEKAQKRLFILCIIIFIALIGTNAGWIYYENQFQEEVLTITQDNTDGVNNYIGNDGDITNGATNNYEENP